MHLEMIAEGAQSLSHQEWDPEIIQLQSLIDVLSKALLQFVPVRDPHVPETDHPGLVTQVYAPGLQSACW